ncbi:hypothetical protein CCACVL1_25441 [Corchorus capsularis]|uniref:Uncharacterized protein n=1 Tax=Corchorus capsularis TaxID=210143 RepID=A0A1R3GKE8_COCAP|nr:hypothetical protein CCACVL1_25441 [Corchorus capsularis]
MAPPNGKKKTTSNQSQIRGSS